MESRPEHPEEHAARGNQNTHIAEACGYIKNPESLLPYKNYADAVRKLSGYHVRQPPSPLRFAQGAEQD